MGVSPPSSVREEVSDETLDRDVMAAVPGVKYDSSPLAPPSVASGTVCNGKARPVCCRILNEYEMFPSAKRLVSGNAENALSPHRPKGKIFQPPTRSANCHLTSITHTFARSPFPQGRPIILRSTTGPRSISKLQTTTSCTHLCILCATSGGKKSDVWFCRKWRNGRRAGR